MLHLFTKTITAAEARRKAARYTRKSFRRDVLSNYRSIHQAIKRRSSQGDTHLYFRFDYADQAKAVAIRLFRFKHLDYRVDIYDAREEYGSIKFNVEIHFK